MEKLLEKDKKGIDPHITIVNIYTLIALGYSIFFTIFFYSLAPNLVLFVVHFLTIIGVILNYFIVKRTEKFQRGAYILLSMGTTIMFFLFATGGWENSGILWPFAYIPAAFFMIEGKGGRIFPFILFTGCILIVILHFLNIITIPWSPVVLFNFFLALFVFTILMILYQNALIKYDTQNKESEKKNIELINELADINKELEQFAYVASHDLQEPLRTISNYIGLLEKTYSGKTDQETKLFFTFILAATSKMKNLIKDLLDFSRVGRNITFADVDCNKILKETIADLDLSIKESNAKITSAILPTVRGNETELKRLFLNLISNALKFRKKNSIPEIAISVEEKNIEYLFAIKDNGIGIEEQFINKLFVIFQRLNAATEYPGTGIGLATCKKIVALHNGKIWVESKFGLGSTFYFSLPKKNLKENSK